MSVEDVNKIDAIGIPKDDLELVNLGIADHLPWEPPVEEHLYKLQEKINSYIRFIESGEIYESFPAAKNTSKKLIEICFQYEPSDEAVYFLQKVRDVLASVDIDFRYFVAE